MAADYRHIAGVIKDALFLLVGCVVLLIDDDETELGIGQEQCRARPHHHRRGAIGDRAPSTTLLGETDLRVPHHRLFAETFDESRQPLC